MGTPPRVSLEISWVVSILEGPSEDSVGTLANDVSDTGYIGGAWFDESGGWHAAYWYDVEAYDREDEFVRRRIATVVRKIMKRERIRRSAKLFQSLSETQRRALKQILVRTAPTRRKPGPGSRATV